MSIPYVTTLPWDPIATKITWPGRLAWPHGMLSSINKILSIVDQESRVRLFHHVTKWGPSPVFRAGIAEHVKAQYRTIFETPGGTLPWYDARNTIIPARYLLQETVSQ